MLWCGFEDSSLSPRKHLMKYLTSLESSPYGLSLDDFGFDNSTRIYVAAGEIDIDGETVLDPLRSINLETRLTVAVPEELALVNAEGRSLVGPADADYIVCLLSDIFIPTFDSLSEFANNLIGQRLYSVFRTTLWLDRKALGPLFTDLENGILTISDFEASVRKIMSRKSSGGPHSRVPPESFYINPWPECFCTESLNNGSNYCPPKTTIWNLSYDEDQDDNLSGWIS